jgi:triacylglycerol lipase
MGIAAKLFYEPTSAHRIALLFKIASGIGLGVLTYLHCAEGADSANALAWAIATGVGVPFAAMALLLLAIFTWSRMCAGPGAHPSIGVPGWIALLWREYWACVAMLWVYLPRAPREPSSAYGATGKPLLLVHGYLCSGSFWEPFRPAIPHGYTAYTHTLKGIFSPIADYQRALARRIDEIYAAHGNQPITVIAHSMGGLAMRDMLAKGGDPKVGMLITLGTPHAGTVLAMAGQGQNAKDMVLNSRWLRESLAWQENAAGPSPVKVVALITWHDNIVFPQASAHTLPTRFGNVEKIELAGIGHVELVSNRAVHQAILKFL